MAVQVCPEGRFTQLRWQRLARMPLRPRDRVRR
jgi:hypothetical protein